MRTCHKLYSTHERKKRASAEGSAYTGFDKVAVDDFCYYADEWRKHERTGQSINCGCTDPEYLAGKKHIAKWLRLVKKEVRPDCWVCE